MTIHFINPIKTQILNHHEKKFFLRSNVAAVEQVWNGPVFSR